MLNERWWFVSKSRWFGDLSKYRLNGEKLSIFASEFLAFSHHANVKSMLRCCDSSNTLSIMSAMIKLYLSTSTLLNSDSAAVTLTVMFIDSAISINFEFVNSLSLSVKDFSGASY